MKTGGAKGWGGQRVEKEEAQQGVTTGETVTSRDGGLWKSH